MGIPNPLNNYLPPVGFYFAVNILDKKVGAGAAMDAAFQEVSGISAEWQTEEIQEGGENRFSYKVPGRVKYDNLVLKRGLVVWPSPLGIWCRYRLSNSLNNIKASDKLSPKNIMVQLLDANSKVPIMAWFFSGALPLKWEVSEFKSQDSSIVVETLSFSYNYFKTVEGIGSSYLST